MIRDHVPDEDDQQSARNGLSKLQKIEAEKLNQERAKVAANSELKKTIDNLDSSIAAYGNVMDDIDQQLAGNKVQMTSNKDKIQDNRREFQKGLVRIKKEHKITTDQLTNKKNEALAQLRKPAFMTDQNIHYLQGDLAGNVAVDVSPPLQGPRHGQRLITNDDPNGNHRVIGYLSDHIYDNFSVENGLEQHEYFKSAGDKVHNLVGFIETSQITKQEEEDVCIL